MTRCLHPTADRRTVLRLAAGAAMLLAAPVASRASGAAEALVLTCMDYRLADDVHRFLDSRGLTNRYDHVVLAGASAGAVHEAFPDWHATFWSHLDVAIRLHGIHKVIVIDHRDCGAYRIAFGDAHTADRATETGTHAGVIARFAAEVAEHHPGLEVEAWLMGLDGTAEPVPLAG